jgi:hypothetical protein
VSGPTFLAKGRDGSRKRGTGDETTSRPWREPIDDRVVQITEAVAPFELALIGLEITGMDDRSAVSAITPNRANVG